MIVVLKHVFAVACTRPTFDHPLTLDTDHLFASGHGESWPLPSAPLVWEMSCISPPPIAASPVHLGRR